MFNPNKLSFAIRAALYGEQQTRTAYMRSLFG